MFGWSISASACRSASNRAMTLLGVHAQLDDLERHPPANRFLLLGHINHAAAAFADLLEQFVAADAVAGFLAGNGCIPDGSTRAGCRVFEEGAGFFAGLKEFLDALAQCGIAGARLVKISGALPGRQPPDIAEDGQFAVGRICHVQADFTLCSSMRKSRAKSAGNFRRMVQPAIL